jgi:omega-amidase
MALKQSFRPFTLAFVQLGQVGANKSDNLKHAREMILKAASGDGHPKKPDLVVLPVRLWLSNKYPQRMAGLLAPS